MSTEAKQLKITRQNRVLLNLVWGFSLVIVVEGYVFSPLPGLISEHLVDVSSSLFWLAFWVLPGAFLGLQAIVHLKVLKRYFPAHNRNRRAVIATPLVAFAALLVILTLILPMSVMHI